MGALGVKSHGRVSSFDGDLTYLGKVVARLPVDPFLGKLIVMGYLFGCLRECVIIAAGLSLKNIHSRPFQDELNAYLSKVSWSYGTFSDCLAVLNVYDLWQGMKIRGEFLRPDSKNEKNWARHSYVQLSVLQEVHCLVKELTHRLEALKITAGCLHNTSRNDQTFILKVCFAGAFFPLYYKRNIPEDYEREMCRELSGHDPFTTVVVGGLPADTNILYDHQIRELFKECSQNLEIKYEGSKAYLQFPRTSGTSKKEQHFQAIPGECPTAMHLALKMRQVQRIRQDLVLTLYSPQEAQAKMKQVLGYNSEKSITLAASSDGALKQTLGSIHKRVTQPQLCRLKCPVLPKATNHTWSVYVTHVNTAGNFWVVSNEKSAAANLCYIESKIEYAIRNKQVPVLPRNHIIPGCVCLASYKEGDGMESYYRARIEEMHVGPNGSEEVLVFFVDYGNSEVTDASKLRCLPESVVEMNMMAIECMLAEVKPVSKYTHGMWDPEATAWFKARTLYKSFTVQIYSIVHGNLRVKLLEMEYGTLVSINNLLVSKGFAVKAEEFFLSKQNHELRALYSSQVEESSVCSDYSISSAFSSLSFNFETVPEKYASKRQLRGPDSPLLLRFVALTRTGGSKRVKIDSSSVNSTALDLEPQNPHDRLLLAASVTLDPSESSVTLRGTTLMPPIPGILPLCLLLFCPVAELRISEDGTHYTGALIGLGGDDEGHAIYPDDDIEISFDIPFLQDDLILINLIRFQLNAVLEEADTITDSILIPTQKKLRASVIKLLDEQRKYREPENFSRPYYWRRVPEEDILYPNTNGVLDESEGLAFPLHCGIFLRPDDLNEKILSKLNELKDLQKRLTTSGSLPFSKVNATCPVCCVFLETLMTLQNHFLSTEHQRKELHFKLSDV
ncbi:ATP-dependent RNA helicase TDRD9 [Procambarus clarkii]|uniref:ATP-dependent RNA helicase TDRD9 n=1 Tax=Procambarus clarkii TaxID=6728 RepID=UPI003743FA7B